MSVSFPTVLTRRWPAPWLVMSATLALAACGGGAASGSVAPERSTQASAVASAEAAPSSEPSQAAEPSEAASGPCLDAEILAALEAYMDGDVPDEPSMEEVADALASLELEGRAAEFRDGVVEAFRGETGETLDDMKLHDALFSLIPLQSEVNLVEC
jgi:hypothetical protein